MNEVIELAKVIYSVSGLPLDLCGAIAQDLVDRGYGRGSEGSWIVTEKGCVINCSKCGERLELCYPDGTEVERLPHCPYCGSRNDWSVLCHHGLWLPADEWPPESDGRYLLATDRGEILVGEWRDGMLRCSCSLTTAVKWWMPAPELPKGD